MENLFDVEITCASGVEKVLKSELKRLGYPELPVENGSVILKTDYKGLIKLNVSLRSADRIYILLKSFNATTFDQLFDGTVSIDFKPFIKKDACVYVNGKCVKSQLFAISACQKIVDKAVITSLSKSYNLLRLEETGEKIEIDFYIYKDLCRIRLNTSGVGLNKRGYRDKVGIAPIKETLASSMVLLSDFYYEKPFLDPFCGSGTIAIEALKIALDIPPNLDRDFDFFKFKNYDERDYKRVIEEAKDNIKLDRKVEFFASDIDKKAIKLSMYHLERAGLKGRINFSVKDVKDVAINLSGGTIVTNPPYGTRVYDIDEAKTCYESLKKCYDKLDRWSLFLITSYKNFEKVFGKKADRIRKLYNSEKECNFYYYYAQKERKDG